MRIAKSPVVFLLCVNVLLVISGMFMDVGATVVILAPILHPIAIKFGISLEHFGLVMVFLLSIGQATPPFGTMLFVAAGISSQPIVSISKKLIPFIILEFIEALVFSFVPILTTWWPSSM